MTNGPGVCVGAGLGELDAMDEDELVGAGVNEPIGAVTGDAGACCRGQGVMSGATASVASRSVWLVASSAPAASATSVTATTTLAGRPRRAKGVDDAASVSRSSRERAGEGAPIRPIRRMSATERSTTLTAIPRAKLAGTALNPIDGASAFPVRTIVTKPAIEASVGRIVFWVEYRARLKRCVRLSSGIAKANRARTLV